MDRRPACILRRTQLLRRNRRICFFCRGRRASCSRCSRVRCCRSSVKLFRKNRRSIAGFIASPEWANRSSKKRSGSVCWKSLESSSVIARGPEKLICELSASLRRLIERMRSSRRNWDTSIFSSDGRSLEEVVVKLLTEQKANAGGGGIVHGRLSGPSNHECAGRVGCFSRGIRHLCERGQGGNAGCRSAASSQPTAR